MDFRPELPSPVVHVRGVGADRLAWTCRGLGGGRQEGWQKSGKKEGTKDGS